MRFFAFNDVSAIITDDYAVDEIAKGVHLDNLLQDLETSRLPYFRVYDENMQFVKVLKRRK